VNLAACPALPHTPLTGTWFRAIQPQFWQTSLQTVHTASIPGRFNAGNQAAPGFEILYLSENPMVALFEVQSLFGSPTSPGSVLTNPRHAWIIINVDVRLQSVVDLTDVAAVQNPLGTNAQELTGDWRGYGQRSPQTSVTVPTGPAPTQQLGHALNAVPHLEGVQTLSAKLPYHRNLVIFPQKLRAGSRVQFIHPATGQRHVIATP
jgi:RES domain-containing protein